jgi:hypothetical protein
MCDMDELEFAEYLLYSRTPVRAIAPTRTGIEMLSRGAAIVPIPAVPAEA